MARSAMLKILPITFALLLGGTGFVLAQKPDPEVENSLKEIHAAFEAYRKDHGGEYPPLARINETGERELWPEMLKPYLQDNSEAGKVDVTGPFFTPYTSKADRRDGSAATVSFGYNRYGLGRDGGGKEEGIRFAVREVPEPDETILLVELDSPKQQGSGWYAAWCDPAFDFQRYEGMAHVLYVSGRVAVLPPSALLVDDRPATALAPWFGDLSKNP